MKRLPAFSRIAALFTCAAFALTGCSADDGMAGDSLPEGKYPMTFSTAVEGMGITRATVENTWTGNEKVAVKVGEDVKLYKPSGNILQAVDVDNLFYWQKNTENVSACYLGTETYVISNILPTEWTMQTDQSGDGYQQSDFLYAPEKAITFADRNKASLTFYHQTAKVVINIIKNEFVTSADQITDVSLVNMNRTADYAEPQNGNTTGTWSNFSNPAGGITPKSLAVVPNNPDNILTSYAALVIPQDMEGKRFIRVTVYGNNYYYISTGGEAKLQSGQQYTYNITVKNDYLEVTTATIDDGVWGSEGNSVDVTSHPN